MDQEKKRPLQIIKDWWSVVLIGVAILGGYGWLERNFARVDKLNAEKCSLYYEIRITKADIEFKSTDEAAELQRGELEDLLQLAFSPEKRVEFKKGVIASLDTRAREISNRKECLRRAKDSCFQNDVSIEKCY